MAENSDQAFIRHQYQRMIQTGPAPAANVSRNFHAPATESIFKASATLMLSRINMARRDIHT